MTKTICKAEKCINGEKNRCGPYFFPSHIDREQFQGECLLSSIVDYALVRMAAIPTTTVYFPASIETSEGVPVTSVAHELDKE